MKVQRHHTQIFFYTLSIAFLFLFIYTILIYSTQVFAQKGPEEITLTNTAQIIPNDSSTTEKVISSDLLAKAYVIYDVNNRKVVRSQNAFTPLPIASITKIITVGTLLDTAKKNNIQIQESTKQKIKNALIASSNVDADSLGYIYSYSFGRDLLQDSNEFIKSLGINDLTLTNLTGLDNYDGTASNIGSAESLSKVFAYIYEHNRDVFEYTKFDEVETANGTIKNTNYTTEKTFGIIASKTGFTYEAGGNLGVVVSPEPGSIYVIVVLNSTKEGRFTDMEKLVKLLPLILKN